MSVEMAFLGEVECKDQSMVEQATNDFLKQQQKFLCDLLYLNDLEQISEAGELVPCAYRAGGVIGVDDEDGNTHEVRLNGFVCFVYDPDSNGMFSQYVSEVFATDEQVLDHACNAFGLLMVLMKDDKQRLQ